MTTNPTDAQMKRIMKARETPYDGGIWEGRKLNKGPFVTIRLSDLDALLAIQATEARAQGLVDALEEIGRKSDEPTTVEFLVSQALATWRRT